jgi:hypothetical protein
MQKYLYVTLILLWTLFNALKMFSSQYTQHYTQEILTQTVKWYVWNGSVG